MVSRQLLRACAVLGIILVHSRPGKPEGRGKIERFFETVRMQFLVEIEANPPSSLEELNRLFSAWVETVYHRRVHSETGEAPITRLLAGAVPALPSPEQLHEAFLWSEFRTVTKVATVSLHSNVYEVDAALVASKVEVVFDPFDLTSVEIRFQGRSMGAGIPVVIGRHAHPQARPEAAPAPSPTGIDYLGLALLDRLVFGDADLSRRSGEALPVREHLADLLGVTPLLSAVDELRAAKTAVASTVADLRAEAADADATASEAESAVTAAQHEFDALVADRQGSQSRLRAAEAAAVLAASWDRFRAAASSHNAEVADVLADIGQLVSVDPVDPTASLEQARIDADAELARTRQSAQDADVAAAKAASASELLADSDGVCPTCLRPLSEAERAAALHAHGDRAAGATSGSARASEDTARVEAHVLAINEFSRRLDRLQPPIPPDGVDPGPEASVELSNARAADSLLAEQIGEARARLDTTTTAIVAARQRRQEAARLGSAARQELLLETTANAFEQIADRYLSERIEPLRRDIEHRWKLVFGSDGLVLDPTGGIRLHHGEVTLDPEDMSGGERAIAGVIVRILVAAAVTRIPTLWFDEPLEHLDPRRRASVARTLVQAAAAGTIRQVVATTYEEGIARRLAAAAPDLVGVVYADQAPIGPAAG
jgi:putative transposase